MHKRGWTCADESFLINELKKIENKKNLELKKIENEELIKIYLEKIKNIKEAIKMLSHKVLSL